MEYKQIQELIKTINKSNISELSIKDGEFEITIRQAAEPAPQYVMQAAPAAMPQPVAAPVQQIPASAAEAPATGNTTAAQPAGTQIKSPMIGTFYRSAGPDKAPFVNVGDEIKKGDVICIVEAMKLFNEIESEYSGRIVKVLVDDASPVEYDQPLFIIEQA